MFSAGPAAKNLLLSLTKELTMQASSVNSASYAKVIDNSKRVRWDKDLLPLNFVIGDVAGRVDSPLYGMFAARGNLAAVKSPGGGSPVEYFVRQPSDPHRDYALKWDGEWKITYETFRDMGITYAFGLIRSASCAAGSWWPAPFASGRGTGIACASGGCGCPPVNEAMVCASPWGKTMMSPAFRCSGAMPSSVIRHEPSTM